MPMSSEGSFTRVVGMSNAPTPAKGHRVFALAWLMARAFSTNRFLAIVAYPLSLLILVPYAFRRQLYETRDRTAMVVFGPYSPLKDSLIIVAVLAPLLLIWVSVVGYLPRPVPEAVLISSAAVFASGVIIIGNGSMGLPVGLETPKGSRYQVAALAQRPGTRLSGIQMTLRLRDALPTGSVLVGVATSDQRLRQYQGLGFTKGNARRVYWVAP